MLVKDIMIEGVKTVNSDTKVSDVVALMCLYGYSGLPVVDNDELVGIIAEKDVLSCLFPDVEEIMQGTASLDFYEKSNEYKDILNRDVGELMAKGIKTVSPDMPVLKAAVFMASNKFRRIPVAEGNSLKGMLTLGDVHKALFLQSMTK